MTLPSPFPGLSQTVTTSLYGVTGALPLPPQLPSGQYSPSQPFLGAIVGVPDATTGLPSRDGTSARVDLSAFVTPLPGDSGAYMVNAFAVPVAVGKLLKPSQVLAVWVVSQGLEVIAASAFLQVMHMQRGEGLLTSHPTGPTPLRSHGSHWGCRPVRRLRMLSHPHLNQ